MHTTHELSVGTGQIISFKKHFRHQTGLPTGEWSALIPIGSVEVDYCFSETIFKDWNSDKVLIDWEVVKRIIHIVFDNTDSLLQKSQTMLITLHKEIFGNEYEEKQGYFEFSAIEIVEARLGYLEFDFVFWLESHASYLMDPYFSYHVTFNQFPSLVGVKRQG